MGKKETAAVAVSGGAAPARFQEGSAETLLSQAVASGANIDTLERLMALREKMNAEAAQRAFNDAMAAFQAECPIIKKTKPVKTKSGQVAYRYAPIESTVWQVKDLIKKHGFRYSTMMEFKTANDEKTVKAICRVVHRMGHAEETPMEVPLGGKTDIMSQSQVVAAAQTFAKRYAFLNAFGIMTGDEDIDAKKSDQESAEDAFVRLMKIVSTANAKALTEFTAQMEKSDKYTKGQKERFHKAVSERIAEINAVS